jgi:SAM-dependent methyltransferase
MPAALDPGSPTPFDAQAADFDARVGLPEEICRAVAAAALDLGACGAGDRVVEIGAGTGMIGRWIAGHPLRPRYAGLDLSRGMLEVFRHRPGAAGAPLVQADAAGRWPFADGVARLVFSSRAIHLLPAAHAAAEARRVGAAGGSACIAGWVERRPESVRARLAREMRRRLEARGFAPRSAGRRQLLAACRERGAVELPRRVVATWPALHSPRRALAAWRAKPGLGGVVLPPGVQEEVLAELEAWALTALGGLDAESGSEESYVMEGVCWPAAGRGR